MQQRQLRLGDILDDYCPRERRLTNHAVVAMVGADVKQTRCTTCDAEHEYKHAKVPRQRKKADAAALQAPVVASAPKKVAHTAESAAEPPPPLIAAPPDAAAPEPAEAAAPADEGTHEDEVRDEPAADEDPREDAERDQDAEPVEEGPVHRPLIRAQLPRPEGQPPATRPGPDFTIRQPGGRPNRFRPRHQRGGGPFQGNRAGGNFAGGGQMRGGQRQGGGRPPMMSRNAKRQQGAGRKRSK